MRSRELRPFAVEFKNKRRSPVAPPPSLWGSLDKLLKEASAPRADRSTLRLTETAPEPNPLVRVPVAEDRPRRVLPDLRVSEVTVSDEAVAIRVTQRRAAKKGGKPMLHETANLTDQPAEAMPPPVTVSEPVHVEPAEGMRDLSASDGHTDPFVIAQGIRVAVEPTPTTAPQTAGHRVWKSRRQFHELPRGERWKHRRLPEVCW